MRFIPEWCTGGRWKHLAKRWAADFNALSDLPFEFVKQEIVRILILIMSGIILLISPFMQAAGTAESSFTATNLYLDSSPTPEREQHIKWTSTGIWAGKLNIFPPMQNDIKSALIYTQAHRTR